MANRRDLVKRRKAARNIRKITRTMQLIATARFQAVHSRAVAGRPYSEKLAEMVGELSRAARDVDHPLIERHDEAATTLLLVLTSNRGLCGGYNTSVLRTALERVAEREGEGHAPEVWMVGKKGVSFFRFLRRPIAERITGISDRPRFGEVEPIARRLMERYASGEVAAVEVAYMHFISAGRQQPEVIRLLPLSPEAAAEASGEEAVGRRQIEYEFSPGPEELLGALLPETVRVRLYQCFMEAAVSEQVARMVAMKAATDAAGEMIKRLTREYNRARQTAITMELLDIVGGAAALE